MYTSIYWLFFTCTCTYKYTYKYIVLIFCCIISYFSSAGIGRTGTYIALDALDQLGRKKGKVNVAEYVKKMRENRMNMVQTYVCIKLNYVCVITV
jgi:protein tyrosine phosphatase